ncbi:ArsR/SmtB family transcription factor [Streptomyces sp. NPDC087866]|uniref:ArsR/SmtB family transcription factor n=1 Tax=unclassified Streptomyces TaxID=2593676 RepID=UPI00225C0EEF|nr:ArsR family transcriptional regulator [Streptomyces sp. NBC_01789]MCX4447672.1 ArsR family transcriptional regulator [Streptomyces sp. NBC_01789]
MGVLAGLAFSTSDLAQVRFSVSPMWEVAPSFRLLRSDSTHPVHRTWVDQVRPRWAAGGLDRGWLGELIPLTRGYIPDFLNPAPSGPAPAPEEEWEAIRATPGDRVRRDLDHLARHQGFLGPRLRALRDDPYGPLLAELTKELETYWERALAPYWARIRAVLDADILYRARLAAERGTGRLLDDLHTSLSWDDGALLMVHRKRPLTRTTAGTGLLLIPSAFAGPGLRTRTTPPDPPQLAYRARGVGLLWEPRPVTGAATLSAVLGRSRTLLLAELEIPAATTRLAQRTGLSPAAVSQNLTALRDAGLVSAHRSGRFVLYARTAAAETLLRAASA